MRVLLIAILMAFTAIAGTTNVRIYHQAVASTASVQNKQIGVNTTADSDLGFKMWFGKDADGNVNQFLCKNQKIKATSIRQDSSFSLFDTSKHYRSPLANFDSTKSTALRSTRSYITALRADTIYSIRDTAKIMKADSGNFNKLKYGSLTGGTKISADTINAVKLLNLSKFGGAHLTGDGDIYYDSSHQSLEAFTGGNAGTINRCIFAQSDIQLDSNSISETSLKGTDSILLIDFPVLKDSLESNWFKKGKRLRFGIAGLYSTKSTSPGNITIRLKLNNIVLDSVIVALDANEVDQYWRMDGAVICSATGVSGSVRNITSFNHIVNASGNNTLHGESIFTLGKTINTTIRQRFNLTAQFSLADVANKIRSIVFYLEEIH